MEEVENLRKEVDKLKHSGETDFCVNNSGSGLSGNTYQTHELTNVFKIGRFF